MNKKRRILDYASDSESDAEPPNMTNTSRANEWNDSDAESVDSQEEEALK